MKAKRYDATKDDFDFGKMNEIDVETDTALSILNLPNIHNLDIHVLA